jgi:protein phosphatase
MPDRIDWVTPRVVKDESPWIVYGHQPYKEARIQNKTIGVDLGCVFGNKLGCVRWPERKIITVDAARPYSESPVSGF